MDRRWFSLIASCAILACEASPPPAPLETAILPESAYGALPRFSIGDTEEICLDGPCELGMLHAVAIGPEGDVAFLGGNSRQPQLLRANAATRRTIPLGRTGSGPGEYRAPFAVAFTASGEVLALDLMQHRIVRYAPDGSALAMHRAPLPGGFIAARFVAGDLRFLAAKPTRTSGDSGQISYLALDTTTAERRQIALLPLRAPFYENDALQPAPAAYAARPEYLVSADGALLYSGGERFEVDAFDTRGVHRLRFGFDTEPRRVTAADLKAALAQSLMGVRDPIMRRAITEQARTGEGAGRHPAITRLVELAEGALIVRESPREAQDSVRWVLYDGTPRPIGHLWLAVDDHVFGSHAGRILMSARAGESARDELRWARLSPPAGSGAP